MLCPETDVPGVDPLLWLFEADMDVSTVEEVLIDDRLAALPSIIDPIELIDPFLVRLLCCLLLIPSRS